MTPRLLLAASLALAMPAVARAQNPSADQIINSLRPSGGLGTATRGIRRVSPSSAPEAPAADTASAPATAPAAPRPTANRVVPAHVAAPAEKPSVNLSVQFATNSAELTPEATQTLTELGRALSSSALASFRFRIEGHTDTVGSPEANKTLSDRRAHAVAAFLVDQFHIEPSRLEPVGLGMEGLLVSTPPGTAEVRNRRVQVVNLGA